MIAPTTRTGRSGVWVGAVLMVVGIVGGVALMVLGFVHLASVTNDSPQMHVPGTRSFSLDAGEYVLYGSDSGTTIGDVTVTGPSGDTLATSTIYSLQTLTVDGRSHVGFARFQAPTSGQYQFAVVDRSGTVAPTATMIVGPSAFGLVGATLALVFGGLLGGGLVFLAGLIVLIVALVRRSRAKRSALAGPPPGYGGPPPR